jgi:hypothetical protein
VPNREEGKPAGGHLAIGPGGGDFEADPKDDVVVVLQDGVSTDIDGENGGEVP